MDIATLKTHVTYIAKGLGLVATIGLIAFGWIFYNIYQPMNSLERDSAVQTEVLNGIRGDLQEIKDELRR